MSFPVDTYNIIFGIPNPNSDNIITYLNYVILHALFYIYNCNREKINPSLFAFIIELKHALLYKQLYMTDEGKADTFDKKWRDLLNYL